MKIVHFIYIQYSISQYDSRKLPPLNFLLQKLIIPTQFSSIAKEFGSDLRCRDVAKLDSERPELSTSSKVKNDFWGFTFFKIYMKSMVHFSIPPPNANTKKYITPSTK